MNSHEEVIDKVLAGLRDVSAPAGMERRILNVLEITKDQSPSRSSLRFSLFAAGACCAVLAGAAILVPHLRHPNASVISTARNLPGRPTPNEQPDKKISRTVLKLGQRPGIPSHTIQEQRSKGTEAIKDAQVSHPAPPVPLTEQERLLLRYARGGRTDDLAQISSDRQVAKDQKDAADFQAFFEPIIVTGESE